MKGFRDSPYFGLTHFLVPKTKAPSPHINHIAPFILSGHLQIDWGNADEIMYVWVSVKFLVVSHEIFEDNREKS